MRRRLITAIVAVSLVAMAALGLPLVTMLHRLAWSEAEARVQRQAQGLLLAVEAQLAAGRSVSAADLLELVPEGDHLLVRVPDGRQAALGDEIRGRELSASSVGPTGLQVRLTTSGEPVSDRVRRTVAVMAGFGLAGVAAVAALATWLARRLAAPLDELAAVAARLGEGDFSVPAPRSGLVEVDGIARALDRSSARIAELVAAERAFSANASHQMRSSLTGLRLRLEELASHPDPQVAEEAGAALGQATRLSDVVGELLALARTGRAGQAGTFDLTELVALHVGDWRPALVRLRREVTVHAAGPVPVTATAGAVGQAVDVLLSNALSHGRGAVRVEVRGVGGHAEVVVADEGVVRAGDELFVRRPDERGHGIGLSLARTLVEAEQGRLELVGTEPATFRIVLPAASHPWPPPAPGVSPLGPPR